MDEGNLTKQKLLARLKKKLAIQERKLERSLCANRAKEHVRRKIKEQCLIESRENSSKKNGYSDDHQRKHKRESEKIKIHESPTSVTSASLIPKKENPIQISLKKGKIIPLSLKQEVITHSSLNYKKLTPISTKHGRPACFSSSHEEDCHALHSKTMPFTSSDDAQDTSFLSISQKKMSTSSCFHAKRIPYQKRQVTPTTALTQKKTSQCVSVKPEFENEMTTVSHCVPIESPSSLQDLSRISQSSADISCRNLINDSRSLFPSFNGYKSKNMGRQETMENMETVFCDELSADRQTLMFNLQPEISFSLLGSCEILDDKKTQNAGNNNTVNKRMYKFVEHTSSLDLKRQLINCDSYSVPSKPQSQERSRKSYQSNATSIEKHQKSDHPKNNVMNDDADIDFRNNISLFTKKHSQCTSNFSQKSNLEKLSNDSHSMEEKPIHSKIIQNGDNSMSIKAQNGDRSDESMEISDSDSQKSVSILVNNNPVILETDEEEMSMHVSLSLKPHLLSNQTAKRSSPHLPSTPRQQDLSSCLNDEKEKKLSQRLMKVITFPSTPGMSIKLTPQSISQISTNSDDSLKSKTTEQHCAKAPSLCNTSSLKRNSKIVPIVHKPQEICHVQKYDTESGLLFLKRKRFKNRKISLSHTVDSQDESSQESENKRQRISETSSQCSECKDSLQMSVVKSMEYLNSCDQNIKHTCFKNVSSPNSSNKLIHSGYRRQDITQSKNSEVKENQHEIETSKLSDVGKNYVARSETGPNQTYSHTPSSHHINKRHVSTLETKMLLRQQKFSPKLSSNTEDMLYHMSSPKISSKHTANHNTKFYENKSEDSLENTQYESNSLLSFKSSQLEAKNAPLRLPANTITLQTSNYSPISRHCETFLNDSEDGSTKVDSKIIDEQIINVASLPPNFTSYEHSSSKMKNQSLEFSELMELDVVEFSQFQFSSQNSQKCDSISKRNLRPSHQRRSPRLTLSSSWTNSELMSSGSYSDNVKPVRSSKAEKSLIISSVFQYLVDDAKRINDETEFCLPSVIFKDLIDVKLSECNYEEDDHVHQFNTQNQNVISLAISSTSSQSCDRNIYDGLNDIACFVEDADKAQNKDSELSKKSTFDINVVYDSEPIEDDSLLEQKCYHRNNAMDTQGIDVSVTSESDADKQNMIKICDQISIPLSSDCMVKGEIIDRFSDQKICNKNEESIYNFIKNESFDNKSGKDTETGKTQVESNQESDLHVIKKSLCSEKVSQKLQSDANLQKDNDIEIKMFSQIAVTKDIKVTNLTPMISNMCSSETSNNFSNARTTPKPLSQSKSACEFMTPKDANIRKRFNFPCEEFSPTLFGSEKGSTPVMELTSPLMEILLDEDGVDMPIQMDGDDNDKIEPTNCLKLCRKESVVFVSGGGWKHEGEDQLFVVSVLPSAISVWSKGQGDWENELDWFLSQKYQATNGWMIKKQNKIILIIMEEDKTGDQRVSIFYYDLLSGDSNMAALTLQDVSDCPVTNMLCCVVNSDELIIGYNHPTTLSATKHILTDGFKNMTLSCHLETTQGYLIDIQEVRHLNCCVVGLSANRDALIWNHEEGFLLKKITLGNIVSPGVSLTAVHSLQGYLLFYLMNCVKNNSPGYLLIVNPVKNITMTIHNYHPLQYSWKGMKNTDTCNNMQVAVDVHGNTGLWDMVSGELLADLPRSQVTCASIDQSNQILLYLGLDCGVVQVYSISEIKVL